MAQETRPKHFNIFINQGADKKLTVRFNDSTGAARDVSTSTFYGSVFLDTENNPWAIDTTNAATGLIVFSLTDTITEAYTVTNKKRQYEIWEQDATPERFLKLFGDVDIFPRKNKSGP